jgi:hypothetical protein
MLEGVKGENEVEEISMVWKCEKRCGGWGVEVAG